ncbi:hypothetical protein U729_3238 (plasmid) [Clostridium baratii str. Sullivan]|uniref:Uncharacterized protein n=1 Tax=Clostridium baratii str. Sullivan TaxID=1415775 RepID=A0A0A7G030_9CLOT|nr:hypothetical protein [Clostridium baratii]AIY85213.1 hypothetical protein U729_3238 [Clostridium baratii str. Sullivan]
MVISILTIIFQLIAIYLLGKLFIYLLPNWIKYIVNLLWFKKKKEEIYSYSLARSKFTDDSMKNNLNNSSPLKKEYKEIGDQYNNLRKLVQEGKISFRNKNN